MIPYIISQNGTINATVNGKSYSFDKSSTVYDNIKQSINDQDKDEFLKWVDFDNGFRNRSAGKVTFEDGVIRYNGAMVDNSLSRRIMQLYREGFNFQPLIKFLENCYENPNPTVVERLYDFLENKCIMIDADGFVVGYRRVDPEGWDYYSHTVNYQVGKVADMPREKCDQNSQNTCASSLHLGSISYVQNYHAGQGKILICRTNPKDVTAIPEEKDAPKLRTCRLEVLEEYTGQVPTTVYGVDKHDVDCELGDNYRDCPHCEDDDDDKEDFPYGDSLHTRLSLCSVPTWAKRDSKGRFIKGNGVLNQRDSLGRFLPDRILKTA